MTKVRKLNRVIGMLLGIVEQDHSLTDDSKLKILEASLELIKLRDVL